MEKPVSNNRYCKNTLAQITGNTLLNYLLFDLPPLPPNVGIVGSTAALSVPSGFSDVAPTEVR